MGLIGKVLSFVRVIRNGAKTNDVQLDPGGGASITAEHFAPPGDDSVPLTSDYVYAPKVPQKGRRAALGYIDPLNTPLAEVGEKRIYSRDSGGAVVSSIWLKNDGSIALESTAPLTINGVTVHPDGSVEIPASLTVAGVAVNGHTHTQGIDSGGDTQQNTGPMI